MEACLRSQVSSRLINDNNQVENERLPFVFCLVIVV